MVVAFWRTMKTAIFVLSCCFCLHGAQAQEYELGSTYVLVDILPEDAVKLVQRADGCVHWQGEEATDDDRKKQIQQAIIELKCQDLQNDHRDLAIKYQHDITLTKALDYLRKNYLN